MGVSGSGKTTVGQALARALGCPFYDGDDYHPPENVEKMSSGIPLDDRDREPWLQRLAEMIRHHLERGEYAVFACSALKKRYRSMLKCGDDQVQFIYLHGDFDLIQARLQARRGHYMKAGMLVSQFESLEPPGPEEAVRFDVRESAPDIVRQILERAGRGE